MPFWKVTVRFRCIDHKVDIKKERVRQIGKETVNIYASYVEQYHWFSDSEEAGLFYSALKKIHKTGECKR